MLARFPASLSSVSSWRSMPSMTRLTPPVLWATSGVRWPTTAFSSWSDFKFSSNLEGNLDNPFAALYYGISTMNCLTISLAEGGAGLGTVWGIQTARRMLADAGFSNIEVLDSPRPQNCIYLCRP
jgi:hypothetical protein